jgi:hypothetical protein
VPSNDGGSADHAALAARDRYGVSGVAVWGADRSGRLVWRVCRAFAGLPRWPLEKFPAEAEQEDLDDEN